MSQRRAHAQLRSTTAASCPCGNAAPYRDCCGRLHRGEAAATTAETLMRSRFSAFSVGDSGYLLRTWHPTTRPQSVDLGGGLRWVRLEVLETTGGSAVHTEGTVRFRAHYLDRGTAGEMEENSRFVRHGGTWAYLGAL
ncbi:YchJ family metal-binding protein [Streptosporangium sp. NPDC051022]|uniref:YchJ family protein n=1 Tax=Streptosporangium sp. NPDC051022 TaxID=3155752 RepID=UPI00342B2919